MSKGEQTIIFAQNQSSFAHICLGWVSIHDWEYYNIDIMEERRNMKITNEQNEVIAVANLLRTCLKKYAEMSVAESIMESAAILDYEIRNDELVMMVSYFKKVFKE